MQSRDDAGRVARGMASVLAASNTKQSLSELTATAIAVFQHVADAWPLASPELFLVILQALQGAAHRQQISDWDAVVKLLSRIAEIYPTARVTTVLNAAALAICRVIIVSPLTSQYLLNRT